MKESKACEKEPEIYAVRDLTGLLEKEGEKSFRVRVPGSKSITNRALLLAMLSDGECCLDGALFSDDSRYLQKCIDALGFFIRSEEDQERIHVCGRDGELPCREASVYVGSAGTAARFLTALLGLKEGTWHLDSSEQMRRRPMQPLLDCLIQLGCQVSFGGEEGHFPFTLHVPERKAQEEASGEVWVDIGHSSQFLSALLIAACCSGRDMKIHVMGSHGMAYIDMTIRMMEQFGVHADRTEDGFFISHGRKYLHRDYRIEPDASAAAYFYAMAALMGLEGMVEGVFFDSLQGDVEFLRILERMGCSLKESPEGIILKGPAQGKLKGITVDMHACSDQAITLAAIAPYADSPVTITGIGHIRYQESNRIEAIVTELQRIGIRCSECEDGVTIWPGSPRPGRIRTYDDHRMAMGFSLTGLRAEGIEITDPGCCRKTFENYFSVLDGVIRELAGC